MKRLVETGLMFGSLIRLGSSAWAARYPRALKPTTEQKTAPFPAASPCGAALSGFACR